jgi:EAL domain-containing protein (putative c-di-GMP-specific phosphodiesterase class I)/GGDEF domain-containing protein
MASATAEPVLIVSPRYGDEVAGAVTAAGLQPRVERRPGRAGERFLAEPYRIVVVDARGALAAGLVAARDLGDAIEARRGAMLVLLSRGDGPAAQAALEAGATSILVSPFGPDELGQALRFAERHALRVTDAASGRLINLDREPPRHDELTGLATGDQLQQWIDMLVSVPERPQPVFVITIGSGRFAQVNAAYGRGVADKVLRAVAERLGRVVDARHGGRRDEAQARLLARLAAAEFAVAMAGPVTLADAHAMARELVDAFEPPFAADDYRVHLSGRAGIAASDDLAGSEGAAELIQRSLAALSEARMGEAGAIEVYLPDPDGARVTRRANLEADLHEAIASGGIVLRFQPLVHIGSGQIRGVEALARWCHKDRGELSASVLMETAASAELAVKLGRHIREQALQTAAAWRGPLGGLRLSVNVTAADLADPGFAEALEAQLAASGFARDRFVLEVTEDALIADIGKAADVLDAFRRTGVRVALDDFGAGFSSLAYLARLPIDAIKIDHSFAAQLVGSTRERMVVEAAIALGRRLGFAVTAEGVENDTQLAAAQQAGCDFVQGFHIAMPLDEAALARFCDRWQPHRLAAE